MKIDAHPLYPTSFVVGHRISTDGPGQPEEVGAIVVKGTFHGLATPEPAPESEQVQVLMADVPFLVPNGDFDDASLEAWTTTSATLERIERDERQWGRLTSTGAGARMSQQLTSSTELTGRHFILGFEAWVENLDPEEKINVEGFRLESVIEPSATICEFTAELTGSPKVVFSEPGEWPDLGVDDSFTIILVGTGDSSRPIYFDNVQVHEDRVQVRYESDLAVFKPHADVVVLGASAPPTEQDEDDEEDDSWHVVMAIGSISIEKFFDESEISEFPTRTIFGWAPTGQEPRLGQAGVNLATYDPVADPLPEGFSNGFYNGYDRALSGNVPLDYFLDGEQLTFRTERRPTPPGDAVQFLEVSLPPARPTATLTEVNEEGQDQDTEVELRLDTVVIEPDLDRYMVTWRGTWEFDPERQLGVSVTGGPE